MQKYAVVEMIYFINKGCVIFWKNMFLKIDFKRAKYILTKSGECMCAMLCLTLLFSNTLYRIFENYFLRHLWLTLYFILVFVYIQICCCEKNRQVIKLSLILLIRIYTNLLLLWRDQPSDKALSNFTYSLRH